MPTKLEKERKFLVAFPKSWTDLAELFDGIVDVKRIEQYYLLPEPGQQAARVRKTVEGLSGETNTVYHYNRKKPVETGVHQETERKISAKEYRNYLKQANPKKQMVQKTRFVFKWHDQVFELDLFRGALKGLAILEIELDNIDMVVDLPPFLQMIREITDDKRFTNFALADLKDAPNTSRD
jgi:CYTH domain-containing protein